MLDLTAKRILVMGLGHFGGGVGVTRFLAQQGPASILVTDQAPAEKLQASVQALADLPNITFRFGDPVEADFRQADIVVVNPAVKPNHPMLAVARDAGAAITSEIRLLVERLPNRARTIGVTGTAGKSTTTAMVAHILNHIAGEHHGRRAWMGGNIGGTLLDQLDQISSDDWVVLELSSFMLDGLREDRWSPHIAVVTNLAANHLDWHTTAAAYQRAKQAILDFQDPERDIAIFGPGIHNRFDHRVRQMSFRELDDIKRNPPLPILLPGLHNQVNATLACDTAETAGVAWTDAAQALASFTGLHHRLQFVLEHAEVRYYNDSKSTTPEAAMLAIRCFPAGTVHAILGGYDKQSDLRELAQVAATHCRALYTIGATGDAIADAAEAAAAQGARAEVVRCGTLERAVEAAVQRVHQHDSVLLSPACASWDQFTNFEERGRRFAEQVHRCTSEGAPTPRPG